MSYRRVQSETQAVGQGKLWRFQALRILTTKRRKGGRKKAQTGWLFFASAFVPFGGNLRFRSQRDQAVTPPTGNERAFRPIGSTPNAAIKHNAPALTNAVV